MTEVFQPAQYTYIHTAAQYSNDSAEPTTADFNRFTVNQFSGVALGKFGFVSANFASPYGFRGTVEELADASGEWMALGVLEAEHQSDFLIFGDASGFCPIFYSVLPGDGVIVSDSFHGVIRGLRESDNAVSLNIGHYVAAATAHHLHFENPSVQQTMASEISILRKEEALLVSSNGIRTISRSKLGTAGSIDDYDSALAAGIESIKASLHMLSQQDSLIKTINLSGGVDSRMALSFITSADLQQDFSVNSSDPRTWQNPNTRDTIERDIAIANMIRQDLGMEWAPRDSTRLLQFDFQDSLAFHQGFRSNFSFNFRPTMGHSVANRPHLTIRGGGGELLRATATGAKIAASIDELYGGQAPSTSNADLIQKWYLRRSPAKGDAREILKSYFSGLSEHFKGESMEESLNSYYQHTRNRTHFGHLRQSHTTNNTSIHLLANSFFIRAGELLPFEVKRSGKLVKDIFNATDTSLLKYEFESRESTKELSTGDYFRADRAYGKWLSEYDAVAKTARTTESVPHWSAKNRGIISPYDRIKSSEAYLARAFRVVEDLAGSEHSDLIRNVHSGLKAKAAKSQTNLFSSVAKVASAVDLRFPVLNAGNVLHLYCGDSNEGFAEEPMINLSSRVVPRDGWNDQPVVETIFSLKVIKKRFVAEVETNIAPPAGMKFAFHLYRGSKKVGQSWYAESQRRVFDTELEPGSYTVRGYVRSSGELTPSYNTASLPIVVSDEDLRPA